MAREKFPGEQVEKLKTEARLEETLPVADTCADCALKRRETGDPTFLCDRHLAQIYGAKPV